MNNQPLEAGVRKQKRSLQLLPVGENSPRKNQSQLVGVKHKLNLPLRIGVIMHQKSQLPPVGVIILSKLKAAGMTLMHVKQLAVSLIRLISLISLISQVVLHILNSQTLSYLCIASKIFLSSNRVISKTNNSQNLIESTKIATERSRTTASTKHIEWSHGLSRDMTKVRY